MSRIAPGRLKQNKMYDSVANEISRGNDRGSLILQQASRYYALMQQYREERERNKRYTYGRQWDEIIEVDGERITEEEYIKRQGNVPLKNNLIRRLVRNIIGVYRNQSKEPTCTARDRDEQKLGETMSTILQYNMQMNRMSGLLARTLEEFLIGSLIVHRLSFGWRNGRNDCWTDYVQPNNFFIDSNMRDFRGWDVTMLGEIHDISYGQMLSMFAKTPEDRRRLSEIYHYANDPNGTNSNVQQFGHPVVKGYSLIQGPTNGLCRVIEVWRKEQKERYRCHDYLNGEEFKIDIEDYATEVEQVNQERIAMGLQNGMAQEEIPIIESEWFVDDYWYYYYLSPFGDILQEGETPYEHKSHPYVFKAYPFIDGEIHSFVADVIDQQRYTNRLITLYDWVIRSTAKGVLLVPSDCLGEDVSIEDIADRWSEVNGVIVFHPSKSGQMPQQVASNAVNIGIGELLNLQLKFFEDISGVNGALQGKPGYAGTSAALYNQQTQNATTSLLDILEVFSEFTRDCAYKNVKNIQQFYDNKRMINIAGKKGADLHFDEQKIRDVEFDLSIKESTTSAAYRQLANDMLMQLWQSKAISVEQMLEHGDFPFADELLQSIRSQKEAIAQGEAPEGISPQIAQQIQQQADPRATEMLNQYMQ